jgi:hypothetical protein
MDKLGLADVGVLENPQVPIVQSSGVDDVSTGIRPSTQSCRYALGVGVSGDVADNLTVWDGIMWIVDASLGHNRGSTNTRIPHDKVRVGTKPRADRIVPDGLGRLWRSVPVQGRVNCEQKYERSFVEEMILG